MNSFIGEMPGPLVRVNAGARSTGAGTIPIADRLVLGLQHGVVVVAGLRVDAQPAQSP